MFTPTPNDQGENKSQEEQGLVRGFTLTSAKITGSPGPSGWSQVHDFAPEDPEKLKLRGHLFAVVATSHYQEGIDVVVAGRELLTRLHEEYFGDLGATAYNALAAAVGKVTGEFKNFWGDVEIAAVSVTDDVVYSAASGGGQVAIIRSAMLAKILESPSGPEGSVAAASGYPKPDDVLILGTKTFFKVVSVEAITKALVGLSPEAAVESLGQFVHEREDTGALAVAILKFNREGKPLEVAQPKPDVTPFLKRGIEKLTAFVGRFLPERKIYIKDGLGQEDASVQRRKLTLSVGLILLILLILSIGFGVRQKGIRDFKAKYEGRLASAEHELSEAESLASLNPERSRELFVSAKGTVNQLISEKITDPKLSELTRRLDEEEGRLLGVFRSEPELFVDLSLLSSGFKGDDMAASGKKIFVLDKAGRKVVGVGVATKKTELVGGPGEVEEAKGVAGYEDRVFVLTPTGINEVDEGKTKVIDKDWGEEVSLYAYAGNLYLLDKVASSIWRYPGTGKSFGGKQSWLGSGIKPDFSDAISWTIDGNVWVLLRGGRILRFNLGSSQNFTVSGVFPELVGTDAIYTNEDNKSLYILDRGGKRVIVLGKDGKYKAQYISDKIGEATSLAVSENDKKIILLTGSKLYSMELKHL